MSYQQVQTEYHGQPISRRVILNLAIDVLALRAVHTFQEVDTNRLYDAFPTKIPGAIRVDKRIKTEGANHVLVHIRQKHYRPENNELDTKQVGEVQDDIYKILSYLIGRNVINRVYDEGTTPLFEGALRLQRELKAQLSEHFSTNAYFVTHYQDMLKKYNEMLRRLPNTAEVEAHRQDIQKQVDSINLELERIVQQENQAKNLAFKLQQDDKEQEKTNGAVARLHNEGKLEVIAAEEYEQQLRADIAEQQWFLDFLDAINQGRTPNFELPPEILDQREDVLLNLVSRNRDPFAVTVYGGLHDWRNNIGLWNMMNTDQKYSLIVITPTAYEQQEKAKKQ